MEVLFWEVTFSTHDALKLGVTDLAYSSVALEGSGDDYADSLLAILFAHGLHPDLMPTAVVLTGWSPLA